MMNAAIAPFLALVSFCIFFTACDKPKHRLLNKALDRSAIQFSETEIDNPSMNSFGNGERGLITDGNGSGEVSKEGVTPPVQPPLFGGGVPPLGGPGGPGGLGGPAGPPVPTDSDLVRPIREFASDYVFPMIPPARCGDGILQIGEECDLGPANANGILNIGCNLYCQRPFCGNFITELGEQCDDGNHENGDGCSYDCLYERCGNNMIDFITPDLREQCDDGNNVPGDGCSPCCMFEVCGNGIIDYPSEQCDLGAENGTANSNCSATCQLINCPSGLTCNTGTGTIICS